MLFSHYNLQTQNLLDLPYTFSLNVQSCKLYNNKDMIALTQIRNTEIFAFIAVLVFKLLSRLFCFVCFVYKQKRQQKLLKSKLLLKQIANFTGKLLQRYKCEIFRIPLKHVSDHLSVFFHDYTFFSHFMCFSQFKCLSQETARNIIDLNIIYE